MPLLFDGARVAYYDGNGDPLSGGKVYFYEAGTTTPKNTFSDAALSVPNTNPVVLDSAGRAGAIYLDGTYKIVVKTAAGVTVFTQDDYSAVFTENVQQVATIAAMTALLKASLSNGDQVHVSGYTTAGDGGGGTFYWDSASSDTADGGTIFAADEGGTGRWKRADLTYPTVEWWGAKGDDSTDDATAFNNAVTWSEANGNRTIHLTDGKVYKITSTITLKQGTALVAPGSQGTTDGYGCIIKHYSNSDCLVWDGNGASNAGTGGQLKNVVILKATGYSGGDAVKLYGTDDSHRPGEMVLDNVLVFGTGTGLWTRGIHIDGTNNTTPGAKGVRTINMRKVRVADCTQAKEYILINQGTHVTGHGVQIDTGDGTGTAGMTIKGDSTNVNLSDAIINGELLIDGNADQVNIHGHVATLNQNTTTATGSFVGDTDGPIVNKSKSFVVKCNYSPAFMAINTVTDSNVTGDDTDYTAIFDTERYDKNSDYDASTGIFTCVCAGKYKFHAQIVLNGIGASHTRGDPYLIHKNSGGSELTATDKVLAPYAGSVSGFFTYDLHAEFEMAHGDTVECVVNVEGGTKSVGVVGATDTEYTFFSGHLI